MSECFAALRQAGLWPSIEPFETLSPSELVVRARCAREDSKHSCSAEASCPLKLQLEKLVRKADWCCENIKKLLLEDSVAKE